MRLQGISIIFALIVLPIILVIAYYISLQIDTITLQNKYTAHLLDATYDAMSSFELNTANEDLSTVSDSLRTIIEASDNIFMNALATNLGMSNASKSRLEPYVPAVLHTLYDGYYIYAPTYAPTVLTDPDGNAVYVGAPGVKKNGKNYTYDSSSEETIYFDATEDNKSDYKQLLYLTDEKDVYTTSIEVATKVSKEDANGRLKAKYTTKNILKSYIPYSARYVQKLDSIKGQPTADVNVIYTLDNYLTIEGTFTYDNNRKIYWTKSGYLVPFNGSDLSVRVAFGKVNEDTSVTYSTDYSSPLSYNQNEIQEYIEAGNPIKIQVMKDLLKPGTDDNYETIIEIDNNNKALIDKTNTNTDSDTAKLTRYENALFKLEEFIRKLELGIATISDDKKVILEAHKTDDPASEIERTEQGDAIYNVLVVLEIESEFENFKNKSVSDILTQISNLDLINRIKKEKINPTKYKIELNSAAVYYAKAAIFSTWVKDNLSDLKINSIKDISGLNYTTYTEELVNEANHNEYNYLNLWNSTDKVFDFINGNEICGSTEIKQDSSYYTQKLAIIRTSIQYNLNLSMSSYNRHIYYYDDQSYAHNKDVDYTMPIMSQFEWEQILSNISIVSFMQGWDCYLKKYNNYVVVSSSNNEIMTTSDNIYYAKVNEFNDENSEYHKYNCNKVRNSIGESDQFLSFSSKEVKYDKISTRSVILPYTYDHKNLACYECINDGNYRGSNIFEISSDADEENKNKNLRKSFYIGVAKERNDVYKMNAVKNSQGYEILFFDGTVNGSESIRTKGTYSLLGMDKIKQIEVTFGPIDVERRDEGSLTFGVQYGSNNLKNIANSSESMPYSIPTDTPNKYTWSVEVNPTIEVTSEFDISQVLFVLQKAESTSFVPQGDNLITRASEKLKGSIVAIRIIYK